MITPTQMKKIRISGAKSRMKETVESLHELGLVHLTEFGGAEVFKIGEPFPEATELSEQLLKLRGMISHFGLKGKGKKVRDYAKAKKQLEELHAQFSSLTKEIFCLKEKISALEEETKTLEPLEALHLKPSILSGYSSLSVFRGTIKKEVRPELEKKVKDFELIEKPFNKSRAIALFVSKEKQETAQGILAANGFKELTPSTEKSFEQAKRELKSLRDSLASKERRLERLKNSNPKFILDFEHTLSREIEKAEVPLKFATTANSFVVSGWIPAKKLDSLNKSLAKKTGEKVLLEKFDDTTGAPIKLDNPDGVKNFEFYMGLYSYPKYREIDPSFLMFLTFPLFFGFMLGDIGYGLVLLSVFYFISRKVSGGAKMLLKTLMISALATIGFGFVFGEFFGAEIIHHPLIHRSGVESVNLMIMISLLVGFVHINLGLLIGLINRYWQHGLKHAFFEKGSWFLLELGVILVAAEFLGFLSGVMVPAAVLALASVFMLYKGEGIKGLIEIPALLSNTLSYARLFAIGLASVQLAVIINRFAGEFMEAGGFMVIAAVMVLVLGHGVNIALGLLGPFLHSLRLHYVEFFTKFFEGGGKPFSPFGQQR